MIKQFALYLFIITFLSGCSDNTESGKTTELSTQNTQEPLQMIKVAVVNYPLKFFAQQIGQESVDVIFLADSTLSNNTDPAYWKPTPEEIRTYQQADVIFLNGANYARWIDYATLPEDKLVNSSRDFQQQYIPTDSDITHKHGPQGGHTHGTLAFTTWLDMQQAIQQADTILTTLIKLKPDKANDFKRNFERLKHQLTAIDQQLTTILKKIDTNPVIFSHPVYQYFQKAYQVNGISVHWEPNEMPDKQLLAKLSELNKTHAARWMIWEASPLQEISAALKERGIQSIVFDPVSTTPAEGDFILVMQENIRQLKSIE